MNIYYFIIKKCKKVSILANCSIILKGLCHCSRKNPKSEVLEWAFRYCLLMFAESQVRVGPDWRCWWVLDKGFPAARTFARRPVTTDSHPPNHPPPNHNAMLCVHGLSSSLFVNGLFINSCGLSHQTDIANGNEIRHERTTEIHMPFSRSWRVKLAKGNAYRAGRANSRPSHPANLEQIANLCWTLWAPCINNG